MHACTPAHPPAHSAPPPPPHTQKMVASKHQRLSKKIMTNISHLFHGHALAGWVLSVFHPFFGKASSQNLPQKHWTHIHNKSTTCKTINLEKGWQNGIKKKSQDWQLNKKHKIRTLIAFYSTSENTWQRFHILAQGFDVGEWFLSSTLQSRECFLQCTPNMNWKKTLATYRLKTMINTDVVLLVFLRARCGCSSFNLTIILAVI